MDFVQHEEGRLMVKDGLAYHYDLKDHLGNTRVTFSNVPVITTAQATMEASAAPVEEAVFEGVAESRQTLAFHNTTDASTDEPQPNKVATLLPGQTGPAKSLSVRRGDRVHLQVNAAYETGRGKVQGLEGIATQVAEAASRTATGLESSGAASGSNALGASGALTNDKEPGVPSGYLNYLVYDERYRLVDQGFVRVSEEAAVEVGRKKQHSPEALALDVDIAQNGFLYAYLSNEPSASSSAVHFDDFTVEHEGISIVQHNDFYAFGAVYQQSASRLLSNKYLYQGKELQDGLGLELYDFHARQYDPLLGRMTSIDPMAAAFDGMSPYAGMGNNPVSYVDPTGEVVMIFSLKYALIGAGIGGVAGGVIAETQGKDFWEGFGYGAAIGFATGGFVGSDFAKKNIFKTHTETTSKFPNATGPFRWLRKINKVAPKGGAKFGSKPIAVLDDFMWY